MFSIQTEHSWSYHAPSPTPHSLACSIYAGSARIATPPPSLFQNWKKKPYVFGSAFEQMNSSLDFRWPPDPVCSYRRAHKMADCAVAICHVETALAQGFLHHTHYTTQTCPDFNFFYIYICTYTYVYTYIIITTVPGSLDVKAKVRFCPKILKDQ